MCLYVSCRGMRPGEVEGKDYYFVSKEQFEEWIAGGQLLEHARVYGEYKGIPRGQVDAALQRGADVVLRIDVQVGWDHSNCGTELFTSRRRFLNWMGVHEEAALQRTPVVVFSGSQGASCWSLRWCTGSTRVFHGDRWRRRCSREHM